MEDDRFSNAVDDALISKEGTGGGGICSSVGVLNGELIGLSELGVIGVVTLSEKSIPFGEVLTDVDDDRFAGGSDCGVIGAFSSCSLSCREYS